MAEKSQYFFMMPFVQITEFPREVMMTEAAIILVNVLFVLTEWKPRSEKIGDYEAIESKA